MKKNTSKTDSIAEKLVINPLIPDDTAIVKLEDGLYAIMDMADFEQLKEIPICFGVRVFHRIEMNLGDMEETETQITYQFSMYEDEEFTATLKQQLLIQELNQGYRYTGPKVKKPTEKMIEQNSERTIGFMSTKALFQWLNNQKENKADG